MKRANVLVGIGAALVLLSLALVWLLGRSTTSGTKEAKVAVLVARTDLSRGQAGDDIVAAGGVGVDKVPESQVQPGALSATSDLAGSILGRAVGKGDQLTSAAVRPENLRSGAVTIPKGKQAVAITVGFTNGGAGYAGTGDHVNVYTSVTAGKVGTRTAPYTRLLLSDVEVLDVSNEVAPRRATDTSSDGTTAARDTAGSLTLLLALDAQDAERAVFASSFDQLWLTVLPDGQGESTTAGVSRDQNYVAGG